MKPKRQHPEKALQKAVVEYLTRALPKGSWFTSIPGGEGRATRTPGYTGGCPDVIVLVKGQFYSQFFGFELKAKYRKPSSAQREGILRIKAAGGIPCVAWSVRDVQNILFHNGIKLRAKVSA